MSLAFVPRIRGIYEDAAQEFGQYTGSRRIFIIMY